MNDTKSMFTSKGVWGAILTIVAAGIPAVIHLAKLDGKVAPADVNDLLQQALVLGGGVLALYGRITATKTIA